MISSGPASNQQAGGLAKARFDSESSAQDVSENLTRTSSSFSLATILDIPVGYEDDTGFYCGEPQAEGDQLFFEHDINTTRIYQF
jgi:hypothetical protein